MTLVETGMISHFLMLHAIRELGSGLAPSSVRGKTRCKKIAFSSKESSLNLVAPAMNPIKRRIWELEGFEVGRQKKDINKVCRETIIPNRRYAWRLFSIENDIDAVDEIVLDLNA